MNFSVAQVWVDPWVPLTLLLAVVAYATAAALAGRRFGTHGVWGACAVWTLLTTGSILYASAPDGAGSAALILFLMTAPGVACAGVLAWLAARPRRTPLPVRVAAASVAFLLTIPLAVVATVAAVVALA